MRLQNYWWLLIWLFLCGALSRIINIEREEVVDGESCIRWKPLHACLITVPYIIWAGWREWFGDTEQYRKTFKGMPSSFGRIKSYMATVQKGHGFKLFELLFKSLVSRSDIAFFLFVALIQMACLVYIYRKYSTDYWLSMFFFVASTDYLSWMHNGIRQFIAATLVFLCIPLIAKKRYILAIIIVLLASQIHLTVLIFLPFIFVVNGRSWNVRTLIFIVCMIVAVIFADRITGILTEAIEDTAYRGDILFLKYNGGTNFFRVLFYSVPAIMTLVFRPYLDRADDALINVCANLSIVTAGFYVFSLFTSGILMGSLPIYFSLSNYVLIPWLIREVFDRESAKYIAFVFVLVYTCFFYYQCGPTWGVL